MTGSLWSSVERFFREAVERGLGTVVSVGSAAALVCHLKPRKIHGYYKKS